MYKYSHMISACLAACHMAVSFHTTVKEYIRENIDIWNAGFYDTHIDMTEIFEQKYGKIIDLKMI